MKSKNYKQLLALSKINEYFKNKCEELGIREFTPQEKKSIEKAIKINAKSKKENVFAKMTTDELKDYLVNLDDTWNTIQENKEKNLYSDNGELAEQTCKDYMLVVENELKKRN